jgi:hypothetical protein
VEADVRRWEGWGRWVRLGRGLGWEVGPGEAVEDGLMQGGRGFQQDRQSNSVQQMRVQCYFVPDRCVPERKVSDDASPDRGVRPLDEASHGRDVPWTRCPPSNTSLTGGGRGPEIFTLKNTVQTTSGVV